MRHYYYTHEKKGLDITCNICGCTEFLQRLKDHEIVGGKLINEVYTQPRAGWTFTKTMDICPECSAKEHSV